MTPRFRRMATWVVLIVCLALAAYGGLAGVAGVGR